MVRNAEDKYIYLRNGKYQISRHTRKHNVSYGVYNTIKEARKVRDKLVENNWDESYCNIKRKGPRDINVNPMLYIANAGDKYYIQKSRNGDVEIFSVQTTDLEWLKKERDWMVECNWDWDCIVNEDYDEYMIMNEPLTIQDGRIKKKEVV